ncbi:hypothetical protein A2625_06680 [candidate division WOR-1 bacterium RIFCSPHIGHO2_01_FULL_53_15]|uniref:4Fe-4S ferredoxin-type domain-containing protein n=1 Tax=candidate division WOR-1 bacterium RIFCSPHIGHO2_01_FULL_53_15 TaxID=1802564 RepID=A0A1F4Q4T6_UNCSA|nr:MAG: hypothetical protein A2625_06680 [candidate division WOR-1 bacterium RIFCSPHIGHO2_01_FULL_53_15]OGC10289.1 MAG: hypothetical protein A3D23_06685 [candidate division WOR-1 bacterium RIFCSPHIGHO2_02_FULL_53_26]
MRSRNDLVTKSKVIIERCDSYSDQPVDAAIHKLLENLGGLEQFVKPGDKVLIKPNALMGASPKLAVTTHPTVITSVVKAVVRCGGIAWVGDSPGNAYANVEKSLTEAGIKQAAESAGAKVVYFQKHGVTYARSPSGNKKIKRIPIANPVLDANVIINIAKLKTHGLTLYTGAIKNMFGSVPGFHKSHFHKECPDPADFARSIVDVFEITRPKLNIIDAVYGMEGNGPSDGAPRKLGLIMASTDAVALDAVGSYLIGFKPSQIETTKAGYKRGLGEDRLEDIEVVGARLDEVRQADWKHAANLSRLIEWLPEPLYKLAAGWITVNPSIDQGKCTQCMVCVNNCPVKTIHYKDKVVKINLKDCIHCFCCHELCEYKAVKLNKSWLTRLIRI